MGSEKKTDNITRESEQKCHSYGKITLPAAESVWRAKTERSFLDTVNQISQICRTGSKEWGWHRIKVQKRDSKCWSVSKGSFCCSGLA